MQSAATHVNVLGVRVPELQLSDAVDGLYPETHCVVHEDPELMLPPWLQAPELCWFVTVGAVQAFAWQVNVVGVSDPSLQLSEEADRL